MRPLILTAALALTLTGCSTRTGTVDDHPSTPTAPSAVLMSVAEAKKVLLTLRDFPTGWTGGEPINVTPEDAPVRTYARAEGD